MALIHPNAINLLKRALPEKIYVDLDLDLGRGLSVAIHEIRNYVYLYSFVFYL